jgi:methylmalonyl-CoA mutase N-terminal domain/subunit
MSDTNPSHGPEQASVRLSRTRTWGGLETRSSYGPDDVAHQDYRRDHGDPGTFPYTRGSYSNMYRDRMWTLRNIVGYGTPADTRDGIERARAAGSPGIDVVLDIPSQEAIDPDHPSAGAEVGMEGCTVASVRDLEQLLQGIDVTETDIAWHSTLLIYPMIAAMTLRQGLPLERLQGSSMPDHFQLNLTGYGERLIPFKLAERATIDSLEYISKQSPRWACGFPQMYTMRERGLTPAGEIAVGMAIVNLCLRELAGRGVDCDDVAPSLAWVSTSDIDLFEEVAKYRALRRVWARTLSERFGATNPRSLRLRIACHTSGRSLTYQQPYNNLARATVQTLAAILGGVQSVETCTYDEPICIPTHEARELAIRTQQILAHEVGAARTADPLGGSWYVESLTDEVESAALALLAEIEGVGLANAVESGWLESLMDNVNYNAEQEIARGERIVVGVNAFTRPAEEVPTRFTFDTAPIAEHVAAFSQWKSRREHINLDAAIRELHDAAIRGENCIGAMIRAFMMDATIGEVWGTFREAMGYHYDPFGVVQSPFTKLTDH